MNAQDFHCTPYDLTKPGFYFSNSEELDSKLKTSDFEEYEIEAVDLDSEETDLFNLIRRKHGSFEALESHENMEGKFTYGSQGVFEKVAFGYLIEMLDKSPEDAADSFSDVSLTDERLEDAAFEIAEQTMEIPAHLEYYIDFEAMGRDMSHNGELYEYDFGNRSYIITNHAQN